MVRSYRLVRCATAGSWRMSALYGWVQKCNGDFLVPWCISGKIFMKIWSVVINILVILPLNVGRGLHSTKNFQNLMACSLYYPWHFQKISSKSVHNFLRKVVDRQTNKHRQKQYLLAEIMRRPWSAFSLLCGVTFLSTPREQRIA